MFLIYLFFLSALVIAVMLVAKRIEEKRRKPLFVLKAIGKGDERARYWIEKALDQYSRSKESLIFWVKKQLPLKSKSYWNKLQTFAKEAGEKYMADIRNSKLMRRSGSEGISEFFKNISEIEKGNGEINEVFEERVEVVVKEFEEIREIAEPTTPQAEQAPKKAPRKRAPRKKKLVVVEAE